ncbi:MAG: hypothetical protein PVJ67_05595 [Candidatus Pacearchaeota archaeon]|jgi:hypothetical protein
MSKIKHRYSSEVENFQKEILGRVKDLILQGIEQEKCSKLEKCNYILRQIKASNFSIPNAHGYLTLICEKYPGACEVNLQDDSERLNNLEVIV